MPGLNKSVFMLTSMRTIIVENLKVQIYNIRIRINLKFYIDYLKITIFSERLRFTVTFRVSLFSCQSERYLTYSKNL